MRLKLHNVIKVIKFINLEDCISTIWRKRINFRLIALVASVPWLSLQSVKTRKFRFIESHVKRFQNIILPISDINQDYVSYMVQHFKKYSYIIMWFQFWSRRDPQHIFCASKNSSMSKGQPLPWNISSGGRPVVEGWIMFRMYTIFLMEKHQSIVWRFALMSIDLQATPIVRFIRLAI